MSEKFDVYTMVTDKICALLENGLIPWARPWSGVNACAWSRSTGKDYSLINQMLLAPRNDYKTIDELLDDVRGEYVTYKQARDLGGAVKRGEKGHNVIFWTTFDKKDEHGEKVLDKDGNPEQLPCLRYYTVFRIDQCEGVTQKYHTDEATNVLPFVGIDGAEQVAADYERRAGVKVNHVAGNKAYYAPDLDVVVLPMREQFSSVPEYYSTLYHELTHSTGHKDRLNRLSEKAAFGSDVYSTEELIAEIGSASIMATLGIGTDGTLKNSAAYCRAWLKALKADKRMIVKAAGKAEKAVQMILGC